MTPRKKPAIGTYSTHTLEPNQPTRPTDPRDPPDHGERSEASAKVGFRRDVPEGGPCLAGDDPFAFSGAAVFLRRPALESVGGFDPSLFMYYEDVDVSWRLRLAGHRVVYEPGARVVHRHAGSSSSSGQLVRYRSVRNRLVVTARNGSRRLLARVVLRTVLRFLRDLVGVPYLDGRHRRLLVLEAVPAVVRARRAGRSARRAAVVRPRDLDPTLGPEFA